MANLVAALASEYLFTLFFAFFGGLAPPGYAAVVNGLALVVCVYGAVAQSGGHLNPNVTAALVISGHASLGQGAAYVVCQLAGAITGAGVTKGFAGAPGCFLPAPGTSHASLWGMETITSAFLIVTVYEVAVKQKGTSNFGPFVIGLSLLVAAFVGGPYTGAALNFARVLGPAVVNGCGWSTVWVYFLAHVTAVALAAAWGLFVAPNGPYLNRWRGLVFHFVASVPYTTAADPLVPYDTPKTALVPPYALYTANRRNMPAAEQHRLTQMDSAAGS